MRRGGALPFVLAAGCGNLLGLAQPHEQLDAHDGSGGDAAADGTPIDAGPVAIHLVLGGTADPSQWGTVTSDPAGIRCPGACDATFPPGTPVTLSAGSGVAPFTGLHGGTCDGSAAPSDTCTFTAASEVTIYARWWANANVMFVSSTQQAPGGFDVPANADALCNQLAGSAGLPGVYAAWLSTEQPADDRLVAEQVSHVQPNGWLRPDGEPVAGSYAALVAGHVFASPRLDEFGRDVGDDALAVTDTTGSGAPNGGSHCSDYASTSTSVNVLAGEPAGGTNRWTAIRSVACGQPAHIYCFGANTGQGLAFAAPPGPRLFVSDETFTPGSGGIGSADAICAHDLAADGIAAQGLVVALLAPGGGQPLATRFQGQLFAGGAVLRPDAQKVANSIGELIAGSAALIAAPNVSGSGAYIDDVVWTGAPTYAQTGTDCSGWTSSDASQFGTTRPAATTAGASVAQDGACSTPHRVLCLDYAAAESLR